MVGNHRVGEDMNIESEPLRSPGTTISSTLHNRPDETQILSQEEGVRFPRTFLSVERNGEEKYSDATIREYSLAHNVSGSEERWPKLLLICAAILVVVGGISILSVDFIAPSLQPEAEIRFLAVGDWGREGSHNQTLVAKLMAEVGSKYRPQFIVSTDPNGINSTEDSLFDRSFVNVYIGSLKGIPWHAVLGNHDYGDGKEYCENDATVPCKRSAKYELDLRLSKRDPRWHCERSYTIAFGNGIAELFFIDTSPFDDTYRERSWAQYEGGILEQSWEGQLRELESRLMESNARWKIAIGHHPPRSNGQHGNNTYILERLEPVLRKYGVKAYFSGHDHDLEHITTEGLDIFITGAGSDTTDFLTDVDSKYQHGAPGFVGVSITKENLLVEYFTVSGGSNGPQYRAQLRNSL